MTEDLKLQPVSIHGFRIEPNVGAGKFSVRLVGNADMRAQRTLGTVLKQVHAEALRLRARTVDIDCRELDFMNSSCFKEFISWLGEVRVLAQPDRYRIRFLSDPSKDWQARSLSALSCFAVDVVEIDARPS